MYEYGGTLQKNVFIYQPETDVLVYYEKTDEDVLGQHGEQKEITHFLKGKDADKRIEARHVEMLFHIMEHQKQMNTYIGVWNEKKGIYDSYQVCGWCLMQPDGMIQWIGYFMNTGEYILQEERMHKREILRRQMTPHFIFNMINIMKAYAVLQPEKEIGLIDDFSKYLRISMKHLELNEPVLFSQEMEQIRAFMRLEQARFEELSVSYELKTDDFYLPPDSLIALVENAVRYGVKEDIMEGRSGKGHVRISSYINEEKQAYVVSIENTGHDFEWMTAVAKNTSLYHIKTRLEQLMDGQLIKEYKDDQRVIIKVIIPMVNGQKGVYGKNESNFSG